MLLSMPFDGFCFCKNSTTFWLLQGENDVHHSFFSYY